MMRTWIFRVLKGALAGLLVGAVLGGYEGALAVRTEVRQLLTALQRVELWGLSVLWSAAAGLVVAVAASSAFAALRGLDDETRKLAFYTGRDPMFPWLPPALFITVIVVGGAQAVPSLLGGGPLTPDQGSPLVGVVAVPLLALAIAAIARVATHRFDTTSRGLPMLILGPIAVLGGSLSLSTSAPMAGESDVGVRKDETFDTILVTVDGLRTDHLGPGPHVRTANLEWLAAVGTTFTDVAPPTLAEGPTLASLHTGRHALELSLLEDGAPLRERDPKGQALQSLAERFAAAQFVTGAFLGSRSADRAWSGLDRGFHTYDDGVGEQVRGENRLGLPRLWRWAQWSITPPQYQDALRQGPATFRRFREWQSWHSAERYFAWMHLSDPRNLSLDYEAPAGAFVEPLAGPGGKDYAARIVALDTVIGGILRGLDEDGTRDRTVIVIVGTRGFVPGGTPNLHRSWTRVPAIVFGPGVPTARRVTVPVGFEDLGATLLDAADLGKEHGGGRSLLDAVDEPDRIPGVSLCAGLPSPTGPAPVVLRTRDWTLVRDASGTDALYLPAEDPQEVHDQSAARPDTLGRARAVLDQWLRGPLPTAPSPRLDPGQRAILRFGR